MAQVNIQTIMRQVAKDAGADRILKKAAQQRAQQIFDDAAIGLQQEFESSKVTQEIDAGIGSPNISQTLRGGDASENLYSFIGFPAENNETPTQVIREMLYPTDTNGKKNPNGPSLGKAVKIPGDVPKYQFEIRSPGEEKIYDKTPLPWGQGNISWAEGIEKGIRGFSHFLNRFMGDPSRSGGGIQVKGEIKPGASYTPPKEGYIGTFLKHFRERIDAAKNGGGFRKRF